LILEVEGVDKTFASPTVTAGGAPSTTTGYDAAAKRVAEAVPGAE
jgi:hypothetical protein